MPIRKLRTLLFNWMSGCIDQLVLRQVVHCVRLFFNKNYFKFVVIRESSFFFSFALLSDQNLIFTVCSLQELRLVILIRIKSCIHIFNYLFTGNCSANICILR